MKYSPVVDQALVEKIEGAASKLNAAMEQAVKAGLRVKIATRETMVPKPFEEVGPGPGSDPNRYYGDYPQVSATVFRIIKVGR